LLIHFLLIAVICASSPECSDMVYVGITIALENKVDMLHPGKPDWISNRLLLP